MQNEAERANNLSQKILSSCVWSYNEDSESGWINQNANFFERSVVNSWSNSKNINGIRECFVFRVIARRFFHRTLHHLSTLPSKTPGREHAYYNHTTTCVVIYRFCYDFFTKEHDIDESRTFTTGKSRAIEEATTRHCRRASRASESTRLSSFATTSAVASSSC